MPVCIFFAIEGWHYSPLLKKKSVQVPSSSGICFQCGIPLVELVGEAGWLDPIFALLFSFLNENMCLLWERKRDKRASLSFLCCPVWKRQLWCHSVQRPNWATIRAQCGTALRGIVMKMPMGTGKLVFLSCCLVLLKLMWQVSHWPWSQCKTDQFHGHKQIYSSQSRTTAINGGGVGGSTAAAGYLWKSS